MRGPLVSIVVPLYNKAPWVLQSLNSVMNQTYKNWEIILINDGSTDGGLEIVNSFKKENPNLWTIITIENSGQCAARNLGISISKGKYVAFLDPDDLWEEHKLEFQVNTLEKSPSAVATVCPYVIFFENNKKSLRVVAHRSISSLLKNWLRMTGYGGGTESTGLIRRDALNQLGGFNLELSTSAGLLLTIQLSRLGDIEISRGTYMAYRIHTGQWHGNINQLQMDVERIREIVNENCISNSKNLRNWHDSYFRIHDFRSNDRRILNLVRILLFEPLKFYRLWMVLRLLTRNLLAHVRKFYSRKATGHSLNSILSFLFPNDFK